jgi:ankyrin repeat protein
MRSVIDSLIDAIYGSQTKRVASLILRGAPVNGSTKAGSTPLYVAAVQGEAEIVRLLLEAGADPNRESMDETEGTPLCAAAAHDRAEIVRLLLEHGADPNVVEGKDDEVPMTALRWAQNYGHSEIIRLLLEAGADPGLKVC